MRVLRVLTLKVPNPVIITLSPLARESRMLPKIAFMVWYDVLRVSPTFFATLSTSSFLVMVFVDYIFFI